MNTKEKLRKFLSVSLVVVLMLSFFVGYSATNMHAGGRTSKVEASPEDPYHWKIMLAQKKCDVLAFFGYLKDDLGQLILGTEFDMQCFQEFVFWKVKTDTIPSGIHFTLVIDWDKDGIGDDIQEHQLYFEPPTPPSTTWLHFQKDMVDKMVVVEVHEQPYDPERPFFEWQLTMKQENCNALWTGYLTRDGTLIPGTEFEILCNCTQLQCKVVRTPWCTVPNDIYLELWVDWDKDGYWDPGWDPYIPAVPHLPITQFPWTWIAYGPVSVVELELTEVQMHRYMVMGGTADSAGQLGAFPPWFLGEWAIGSGVPFATRKPYLSPGSIWQNITFTQKDPITGIVKLGVPADSHFGLNHTFWDPRIGTYLRFQILLQEQGCGWIFTGEGKNPILGDVDIITFNNNTGIYSSKPGHEGVPMTPEPCLQNLRGPDGIPGTPDDPIGDGASDPKGSSILYLPTKLYIEYWNETTGTWLPLVLTPFPMLMTTGRAYDIVMEPGSLIDGVWSEEVGHPWRHHFDCLPWKDPECNVKVTYVCSWSKLQIPTALGLLDIMWEVTEYKVREDRYEKLRGDANCDQIVDFKDLFLTARAWITRDEGFGNPVADPRFDARCDHDYNGKNDIKDVVHVCVNYGYVHGYHIPGSWQGTMSVDPSSVTANVGQTFKVNATVSGVNDLYLVLFGIRWNPAVLNLTKITQGPFPNATGPQGRGYVVAAINYTEGYLEAWTGFLVGPGGGDSGGGAVATLEFEVVGPGSSALDLYECSWMNSSAGQYGFETLQDGNFATPVTLTITTTTGGTTDPPPGTNTYAPGTVVAVTAIPFTNCGFDHWELDGFYAGSQNPINVMMNTDHTLHAVFTYNVTIKAHCYTEGTDVSVSITMDGTPTGYNTPHTFTGLTGTHTFTVPSTDQQGHPFLQWGTGETSTTITVTTGGTYTAYYTGIHDIAITDVSPSKTVVCLGYNITVHVALKNNGNYTEPFIVWTFCGLRQNITLPANTSITINYTFSTSKLKKGTYKVWAYVPMPDDARPNDNIRVGTTFLVTIVGDINADGIVDIEDIYKIALAYGTTPGQAGYDPNLDINADGIIDIEDIYIAALHYGETGP